VGDSKKNVNENRKQFAKILGLSYKQFAYQKQIHSDIIKIVEKHGFVGESDALITTGKNIALSVFTADCLPIYIFDSKKEIIAVVHSGWQGTKKKILKKVIHSLKNNFSSKIEDMFFFFGPSISYKNYEVGQEFKNYFDDKYLIELDNGKLLLDIIQSIMKFY